MISLLDDTFIILKDVQPSMFLCMTAIGWLKNDFRNVFSARATPSNMLVAFLSFV